METWWFASGFWCSYRFSNDVPHDFPHISPMIFIIFPCISHAFPLGHRTIFMASHAKDSQYFFTSGSGAWAPDFPQQKIAWGCSPPNYGVDPTGWFDAMEHGPCLDDVMIYLLKRWFSSSLRLNNQGGTKSFCCEIAGIWCEHVNHCKLQIWGWHGVDSHIS